MNEIALKTTNTNILPMAGGISLTDHQQAAYDQLRQFAMGEGEVNQLFVLQGYAGTGKTTLISELINDLESSGEFMRIAIAAPTNKAVKVLREKIEGNLEFGSIHSFLGLRMREQDNGQQECRQAGNSTVHEYDLIIVDEASMLGKDLFRLVVTAIRENTRVIFIGDPAQLPPVGEKNQSPVFDMVQSKSVLSEVVRQAKDNPIIKLSMAIRSAIEADRMITPVEITENLPPAEEGPNACVAYGGQETITSWALFELRGGRDCRIIAFTNYQVKQYNLIIHESLYGVTECPFVVGEIAMVHEQTEAQGAHGRTTLHTSEEVEIVGIEKKDHPQWKEVSAYRLTLKRDNGDEVKCFFAANQDELEGAISANFKTWRELKSKAEMAKKTGDSQYPLMEEEAKKHSAKAWAMRKAFAPLRHIYAITTHKSQGSTFDTAIVDFSDLSKIRSVFDFNRALYVAITRPRSYLAVVI